MTRLRLALGKPVLEARGPYRAEFSPPSVVTMGAVLLSIALWWLL